MQRSFFFVLLSFCLFGQPQALLRDYRYVDVACWYGWQWEIEQPDGFYAYTDDFVESTEFCLECFEDFTSFYMIYPHHHFEGLDLNVIPRIKNSDGKASCCRCREQDRIYSGYLKFLYHGKINPFLEKQIAFTKKYPQYQAYWVETSEKAAKINDLAYTLFKELFANTSLAIVYEDSRLNETFPTRSWYFDILGEKGVIVSLVANCFRFFDYYEVAKDLLAFSRAYFEEEECFLIENMLDDLLEKLVEPFQEIYKESLEANPTPEMKFEKFLVDIICGSVSLEQALEMKDFDPSSMFEPASKDLRATGTLLRPGFQYASTNTVTPSSQSFSVYKTSSERTEVSRSRKEYFLQKRTHNLKYALSDLKLWQGTAFNDNFLHNLALEALNESIRLNPNNANSYKERALAHFELGNIELALIDYKKAKAMEKIPFLKPESHYYWSPSGFAEREKKKLFYSPRFSTKYTQGLCKGALDGAAVALIEFIPSALNTLGGIGQGLWALCCSPSEVSASVLSSSFLMVDFIRTHSTQDCLEIMVPELKELCQNWHELCEYEKGKKTGFILGKYGVEIFAPAAIFKTAKHYRDFKRANAMFTLECATKSPAKKTKILEEGTKKLAKRQKLLKYAIKDGKIIAQNFNAKEHVMKKNMLGTN